MKKCSRKEPYFALPSRLGFNFMDLRKGNLYLLNGQVANYASQNTNLCYAFFQDSFMYFFN